ncbi:NAD-dependent epimerase/dehydratase family protein [Candidatus Stoquefichus massiliensis]|uniref:polysaccharide biosynthesis C-terminal domain-containing protein n=1 Tax=Candidatus Stoquefichus massiliensis TaxID=1470350 RepID=UPI000483A59D|nr:NAD-dependent epimerase/dehydratase family protein [Candidatus Stoquefichus massiliensis]
MKLLITGSSGFVGRNLIEALKTIRDDKCSIYDLTKDINIHKYDLDSSLDDLKKYTKNCDVIVHLAGVNRPKDVNEFYDGNYGFTETLCQLLKENNNQCPIIVSSSIQAERDNDYGKSKKQGEDYLLQFGKDNGNPVFIYRFANLFGKWCRPNYNSVVATWCYNIAHDMDIQINNPNAVIPLCYIDDVIEEIIHCIMGHPSMKADGYYMMEPIYNVSLKKLSELLYSFKDSRKNLNIPDQSDDFTRKLYATYLSYLPEDSFSYPLKMNADERGSFTEFIRTEEHGQVSINISKPGITKGQHWHHTKNEKFLVVSGEGLIQFRRIGDDKIIEYKVSGDKLEVIDIPTGYTHNIINTGETDMVTVMWANEPFNPDKPDTYFEKVEK